MARVRRVHPGGWRLIRAVTLRLDYILLCAAFAWAAILRLGWVGISPFAYDEARLSLLALQLARAGEIPVLGMVSSTGIPNLPGAVWLFALPFALSADPLVATLFVSLVGVVTVVLAWGLARRLWGEQAALVTAWFMAGSPYLAFYSRSIWAQNWLPFLAVCWAWCAHRARRHPGAMIAQGALAGLAPQVHYAGVVLLLPALAVGLLHPPRRRSLGLTLVGMGLAALVALPALLALLPQVPRFLAQTSPASPHPARAWQDMLHLSTGYGWSVLLLGPHLSPFPGRVALGLAVGMAALIGLGVVKVALDLRAGAATRARTLAVLLIWAGSAPLVWAILFTSRVHYHLPSLPAWFVIAGAAVPLIGRRWWPRAVVGVAILLSLAQGLLFARGLDMVGREFIPGGISTPLGYARAAAQFVADGSPVVAVTPGANPVVDGDAAMFAVLLWDAPHRLVDGRYVLVIPPRPSWLLFSSSWLPALDELRASLPGGVAREFSLPKRAGEWPFVAVRITPTTPVNFTPLDPVVFDNFVRLEGVRKERGQQGLRLITLWRVIGDPPLEDIHQFNHVYVPGQEQPVLVADIPVSSAAWRAGDWVITWTEFADLPADKGAWIGVGLYAYPSLRRIPHTGVNPTAPVVIEGGF